MAYTVMGSRGLFRFREVAVEVLLHRRTEDKIHGDDGLAAVAAIGCTVRINAS
ncbi:hypothetical protein HMPREF0294_1225 [Corynebacterium glucuronolyticum ATCC 51867]|nr:hypothetical protein HMPREF0294_1225 [Corynebacterium glucuronolyticum ATCC 51867]